VDYDGPSNMPFRQSWQKVSIPWQTLSRFLYPRTVKKVLAWSEELWNHHGLYSQAIRNAVRYFMTEVEVYGKDVEYKTRKKYEEALTDNFDLMEDLGLIGDDFIGFGNSFTSLYVPFQRSLQCPQCAYIAPLTKLFETGTTAVQWATFEFRGACQKCGRSVTYQRVDAPVPDVQRKPRILRWPPQYLQVKHCLASGSKRYRLDIARYTELSSPIRMGDPLYLAETPWEIIEAVKCNKPLEFAEGMVYHMMQPSAAVTMPALKGWGLPLFMNEFETAVLLTLLDKYTEAIAVDYLVPFRAIVPQKMQGQEDPLLTVNMGGFMAQVRSMIDEHRMNPATWHTLPFPLQQVNFGGDAKNLIPVDLMQFFEHRLLQCMGIPEEFQANQAQQTTQIIRFRMFERQWQFFANQLNKWLTWLTNKRGELLMWERVRARVVPVTVVEDPNDQAMKLQLMAGGQISQSTGLRGLNIDPEYEQERILEEAREAADRSQKEKKRQEEEGTNAAVMQSPPAAAALMPPPPMGAPASGASGGMPGAPAGAPPMGGAPGMPGMAALPGAGEQATSLDDLMAQADQIAQQIMTMDPVARRQQLVELKHSNEALHAQVTSRIQSYEQQAATMGVQAARQGGQAPPM